MDEERPVIAAAQIVLARPDQLDRAARTDRLGGCRQFGDEMRRRLRAASEAAAGQHGLDFDLFGFQPQHAGDRRLFEGLKLAAEPRQRLLAVEAQIAIERLHRGMGEIREDIFGLDHFAGFRERALGIAMLAGHETGLACERAIFAQAIAVFRASPPRCRPR